MSDFSMDYSNGYANNYYNFTNQPIAEVPLNAVVQQFGEKPVQQPKPVEKRPSPFVAEANEFIKNGCKGSLSEKALSAYCMSLSFKMVYGKYENANIQEVLNKDPILNADLSATEAKNARVDLFKAAASNYVQKARDKISEQKIPSNNFKFNKASLTARVCGSQLHIAVKKRNQEQQHTEQKAAQQGVKNKYVLVKTNPNDEQFTQDCQIIKNAHGVYSGKFQCWMIPEQSFKEINPKIFDNAQSNTRFFASFNDFYTKQDGKGGSIPLTKEILQQMVGEKGQTLTQLEPQIEQMRQTAIENFGSVKNEQSQAQNSTQEHSQGFKR